MSYDLTIKLPEGIEKSIAAERVHKNPNIKDFRFRMGEAYYMEVDIETDRQNVLEIQFHIPYHFIDESRVGIDYDIYFDCINEIANSFDAVAFDRQKELFLNDAQFQIAKPQLKQTAVQLSRLKFSDGKLSVHGAYHALEFEWAIFDGEFLGVQKTSKMVSNYECHVKEIANVEMKVSASPKTKEILIEDADQRRTIGRAGEVTHLKFFGQHTLLSASNNKTIKAWDLTSLKSTKTFKGHMDFISDFVSIGPRLLVSSSIGGSLVFWDFDSAQAVLTILHSHHNLSWLAIDSQGNYEHSNDYKGVMRWDFGKQEYRPTVGWGIDTAGQWDYKTIPNTNGVFKKGLVKELLGRYR